MARRVLLVDPDLDALGELSATLRGNGFTVILADNIQSGVERAIEDAPDVILASVAVCHPGELTDLLKADPTLSRVPFIVLVGGVDEQGELPPGYARRADLEALMVKIVAAPPRSVPVEASQGEVRGDLSQVPLIDLLQLLSMNRRSGVLSVTTSLGAGEVRIAEGDVLDAVYRRLEGEKALYRLLGERDGSFAFVPGASSARRRATSSNWRIASITSIAVLISTRRSDVVAPGTKAKLPSRSPSSR
jgi:CheY-like chemotaxis protein